MIQMKSLKNRNRLTDFENKLIVTKGDVGKKDKLGTWNEHTYTTIHKTNNQQGPAYSTENSAQYSGIP